ncbi:hypothetical protein WSK_3816 [Novosphingobium sp. Rr 2-17]|uniref:hypothetical protein n=1 Tax=Novosphingobium sp. Rr 2-17 TaxID=555793 RepID=UPI0002698900|nr:hypothetical protein [Novosphingobium sp. Rr 2-17]EIZ77580.1 hypothetical protein WSK_3816 [Novosphingobium sp. Rr 2-17]
MHKCQTVAYKFAVDPTDEVTLQQMDVEARGILLGPVVVGGATYQTYHELAHADR